MTTPHKRSTLLCVGFGYTAKTFALRLAKRPLATQGSIHDDDDHEWQIIGTTRTQAKAQQMHESGVSPLLWSADQDIYQPDIPPQDIPPQDLAFMEEGSSACIISIPPNEQGCPGYKAFAHHLLKRPTTTPPRWIGYLSSNGVYGDHDGAWVDETTPTTPSSARGKRRVIAENQWLEFGEKNNIPVKIFRLPGIYGPNRSALDTVREGRARRIIKAGQVFNRMHVDDIVNALIASLKTTSFNATSLNTTSLNRIFNLCDDTPSPPQDVITHACTLLNIAPPPEIHLEEANLSPMGKSFYNDNKRVRNDRMKTELGVQLQYPSYKEGLDAIFSQYD